jgi:hypothetical protein
VHEECQKDARPPVRRRVAAGGATRGGRWRDAWRPVARRVAAD